MSLLEQHSAHHGECLGSRAAIDVGRRSDRPRKTGRKAGQSKIIESSHPPPRTYSNMKAGPKHERAEYSGDRERCRS